MASERRLWLPKAAHGAVVVDEQAHAALVVGVGLGLVLEHRRPASLGSGATVS